MTNLKYLDEDIILTVSNIPAATKGVCQYTLYSIDTEDTSTAIFYGNAYLPGGISTYSKTFDITDLVRDERYVVKNIQDTFEGVNVIEKFYIDLKISASTTLTSNTEYVCLYYRNPRLDAKMNCNYLDYDVSTLPAGSVKICQCMQGFYGDENQVLYPHVPHISSDNFGFPVMVEKYADNNTYTLQLYVKGRHNSDGFFASITNVFNHLYVTLTELFANESTDVSETDTYVAMYDRTNNNGYKVGIVDDCYARYYLAWQDRSSGFQVQPFKKVDTYSESFETKEVEAYNHKRKLNALTVKPSFSIQTDYIDEYYYPFYESIFQSPVLLLYDTELDRSYQVMITDTSYTEKTFLNQGRKMFNIKISLDLAKKQIITY